MEYPAGTQIPEKPTMYGYCGTGTTGWLNGSHPKKHGEIVKRQICFRNYTKCRWKTTISVVNCIDYFVYKLPRVNVCHSRYCAA